MMNNNERLAKEIMSHVGGADNIVSLNHCSTRLRLKVKNEKTFDVQALKGISGVLDVVEALGGYQIIVGNNVSKVYQAIVNNYHVKAGADGGRVAGNPLEMVLNVLADIMGPLIPAVVVAGLLSALLTICTFCGLAVESTTYRLLYAAAQAPFYFLPMFVAYTAAKHWKLNPVLTLLLAGILLYPDIVTLMAGGESITLFGLPVTAGTYTSSLIPMVLTCWIMHYVSGFVERYCPDAIRYIFVPFITVVVMIPIMLCISGPVGTWLGDLIGMLVTWLNANVPGLTVLVLGAIAPLMVLTGSHLALMPLLMVNFETLGFDNSLLIAFIGMNFSQFAVSLAVFLKAKSASLKSTAFSTGLTAFLTGTTEPALYGLCLRLKKPLIATFIGCIANGIYCALTGVVIYSFGAPSFFTMANFIDPSGSNNFYLAIGAVIVTIVVTFIATWLLGFDESEFLDEGEESAQMAHIESSVEEDAVLSSPVSGTLMSLDEIKDPVFSSGKMGDGVVILPSEGKVYAPLSGEVIVVGPQQHAVGIRSEGGIEVLVHTGLDSQKANSSFHAYVKEGQHVCRGDLLLSYDLHKLRKAGYHLETPIIITNSAQYKDIVKTKDIKVKAGERLMAVI